MKTIKYQIKFHSYWHCGSGLAAGAGVDALVVKDADKLPFVPGKTIKGLLREAMEELHAFDTESNKYSNEDFVALFGYFDEDTKEHKSATAFFSNAELKKDEQEAIKNEKLQEYLYKAVSSTAIDATKGIAKEHSLRKIEVVVPCELYGEIYDVPDNIVEELTRAMGFIKTMGTNRNRGLGRCTIKKEEIL